MSIEKKSLISTLKTAKKAKVASQAFDRGGTHGTRTKMKAVSCMQ